MPSHNLAYTKIDELEIIGYSVAGEETVVAMPQLDVCFDIGKAPNQIVPIKLKAHRVCFLLGNIKDCRRQTRQDLKHNDDCLALNISTSMFRHYSRHINHQHMENKLYRFHQ